VDGGEGAQLAVAEAVTAVVIERQVAVAAFHAGAAALEQIGAARATPRCVCEGRVRGPATDGSAGVGDRATAH
jgi:hypothetical protein